MLRNWNIQIESSFFEHLSLDVKLSPSAILEELQGLTQRYLFEFRVNSLVEYRLQWSRLLIVRKCGARLSWFRFVRILSHDYCHAGAVVAAGPEDREPCRHQHDRGRRERHRTHEPPSPSVPRDGTKLRGQTGRVAEVFECQPNRFV